MGTRRCQRGLIRRTALSRGRLPPARSAARLWMRRPRGGCFRKGKAGQRMVAVVLHHPKKRGKTYRVAEEADVHVFSEAEGHLEEKRERLMLE